MFSSIGATKKQLKRNVLFEGLIEGIISIPFGILLGCLIVIGLVTITNNILSNDSLLSGGYEQLLYFKFPLICILIIALVSGITVYLSCLLPAIKISKVSPIDAIRNSGEIKLKKKKLKTSKIIKALFGIGGVLADKNIKRNRKKYRTIVISLTVSVIMFVVISACINILKKEMKEMDSSINYNYIYVAYDNSKYGGSEYTKEKREKFEKKVIELYEEKINKFKLEKYAYGYFSSYSNISEPIRISSDYFNDDYFVTYLETTREEYNKNNSDKLVPIGFVAVSDEEFKRISNRYKITQEEKETKALIYSKYRNDIMSKKGNDALKDNNISSLSINYKISEEESKNLDIEIIGEADLEDALLNEYGRPELIVSFDYKNKHEELFNYFEISGLYIYDSDNNKIVDNFENRTGNIETMLVDISAEMKSLENIILIMSIFMYTFIIIITLISITNIFNTISTSTMLRKKEFAILRSMGMSDKEFNRMIIFESILYSLKALIYGLIISLVLLYLVYSSENDGTLISNIIYLFKNLPYTSIIYSIAITVIVILSTMLYSLSKINKQNIIETIRSDNI